MKFAVLLVLAVTAAFATPDDVIARGLKVSTVATDKDGIRTVELQNSQGSYTLQCAVPMDSCSLPPIGAEFALEKSADRIYVGDNVKLTQGSKEAGRFRLVQIVAHVKNP